MPPTKRRRLDIKENSHERWLLTYSDLITLLLAFFVVMYSMSRSDAKQFGKVLQALNGILKGGQTISANDRGEDITKGHGLLQLGNLKMLQKRIDEKFKILGKKEELETELTERGLVIHIMESALFDAGSSKLKDRSMDILDIVYQDITDLPNHIRIEGHTDNTPIQTSIYKSNWELSTARATEVVRYFIDNYNYPPEKISALGYGEFRPVRPNNTIENRAVNRRVDIVILTMELTLKEPTSQLYEFTSRQ